MMECKSPQQLQRMQELSDDDIFRLYKPPCDEMSAVTNFYQRHLKEGKKGSKQLDITVYYLKHYFQEITNREAFGFEAFWSSVGGFIGIFLGYSLMQLPDIVSKGVAFIFTRLTNRSLIENDLV